MSYEIYQPIDSIPVRVSSGPENVVRDLDKINKFNFNQTQKATTMKGT